MHQLSLLLRGLWWRRGLSAAVLAVGTVTTAAAALGPLYARAASDSTLRDQLAAAPVADTGLRFSATTDVSPPGNLESVVGEAPAVGSIHGYPTRWTGIDAAKTVIKAGANKVVGHVVWRDGECAHVVIVHGRCPSAPGEALANQRTLGPFYGIALGGTLVLANLNVDGPIDSSGQAVTQAAQVKIVGSYRPIDIADPFWFGRDYYFVPHVGQGEQPDTIDALLVAKQEFSSLASPATAEIDIDYPMRVRSIGLSDVAGLNADVNRLRLKYTYGDLHLVSDLTGVLQAAQHERHLVNTGTMLVTVQLTLLSWLVLFQIVSDAVEARGNEIALSKLRGLSPFGTARFGLSETLLLLAVAMPLGLLLSLVLTKVFAATALAPATSVVLTWSAVIAMIAAFAGGALAAVVAGYRALTRSVLEQWQRTGNRPQHPRLMLALDLALSAAAVAGLVLLQRSSHTGDGRSATLLAPGLLVFAVALLGVRLLPPLGQSLLPATRSSRRVGIFLASRQIARRPAGLRLAALLAVAVGLATFAVAGESVAHANRVSRAHAELGAAQVVSIQYDPQHPPLDAVRRADPDGRWAMAAATWLPDGGESVVGYVLGVDAPRLQNVAFRAAGGPSSAEAAATIGPGSVPDLTIKATKIRVHITASKLSGKTLPFVQFNFRTPQKSLVDAPGPVLREGTHDYVADIPCAGGCLFRGITWHRPIDNLDELAGTVLITGLDQGDGSTWTPVDAKITQPGAWRRGPGRNQGDSTDAVRPTAAGLVDQFTSTGGGSAGVAYASVPAVFPAVATPNSINLPQDPTRALVMTDDTNSVVEFDVKTWTPVLPAVVDNGVMLNLSFLRAELPDFDNEANWQVWLGPKAPADAISRLSAAGLIVQNTRTAHARVTTLARQGPALALLLLFACAIAASVLAVGGTALSVAASSRRRSFEFAAMRVVGVSKRSLRHAGVLEQLLLLSSAVLLGIPSGLVAARIAMPTVPEFSTPTAVRLSYLPSPVPIVAFALAFIALLVATSVIAGYALIRLAIPARLREAEG